MAKDNWNKTRRKDLGRKTLTQKARAKRRAQHRGAHFRQANPTELQRLQSLATVLWFGKYEGKRLDEVPESYLVFLSRLQPRPNAWRMRALVDYLTALLQERRSAPRSVNSVTSG